MTIEHAGSLFFHRRNEYAKKRLQKLKAAGLIAERPRKQFETSILHLTRRGLLVLRDSGILKSYPHFDIPSLTRRAKVSDLTLRHELAVLDLKVAFHAAISLRADLSIVEFNTWPLLNQFKVLGITVRPDACVRLEERICDGNIRAHTFYVELDRSTETLHTLVKRARNYAIHQKRGLEGGSPFRVLYVLCSDKRRRNIAQRLLTSTPPIPSLVSLAVFGDAKADPLGSIWTIPSDYRSPSPKPSPLFRTR